MTCRDVQHRLQESGLPQKVVDLEQEYAQLAAQGLMNARDVIADKVCVVLSMCVCGCMGLACSLVGSVGRFVYKSLELFHLHSLVGVPSC